MGDCRADVGPFSPFRSVGGRSVADRADPLRAVFCESAVRHRLYGGMNLRQRALVKAAGIEPASNDLRKERRHATSVARARFSAESVDPSSPLESPGVPPQSWRHVGDGYHVHDGHFDWFGLTPRGDRVAPHRPFRTAGRDLRRSRGKRRFDPGRRVAADPRDRCASRPGARETRTPGDETASVGETSDTAGGGSPRGRHPLLGDPRHP